MTKYYEFIEQVELSGIWDALGYTSEESDAVEFEQTADSYTIYFNGINAQAMRKYLFSICDEIENTTFIFEDEDGSNLYVKTVD